MKLGMSIMSLGEPPHRCVLYPVFSDINMAVM